MSLIETGAALMGGVTSNLCLGYNCSNIVAFRQLYFGLVGLSSVRWPFSTDNCEMKVNCNNLSKIKM